MKTKKQALFHSIVSLLLCITMFVGTTFAWFTDSVSSGINMIAAGNLDVELYHSNAAVSDERVDISTKLFMDLNGDPILWEPGVVSYENLRITNEGDLALAYQMSISSANENFVVDPASGAQYGLSQILKVGIVEGGITATDRNGVVQSVEDANWTTLSDFVRSGSLLPEDKGESEKTWGIVIYWEPGENDNLWNLNNGKTLNEGEFLMIDLGIKLIATQEQFESDSFGDDYDANAKTEFFPVFTGTGSVSTPIVSNDQNQVAADVQMTAGQVSATIPAGVQLKADTNELTMTVEQMNNSGANITLGENEAMRSLNVHIEGVDPTNTIPMIIDLGAVMPIGLNSDSLKLYHVEGSITNTMQRVDSMSDLDTHNEFCYDPVTGKVTIAMASFSEVTCVVDKLNPWTGEIKTDWYNTNDETFTIANAEQLAGFAQIVGGMVKGIEQDSFTKKTIKLIADVNLGDKDNAKEGLIFHPIGYYYTDDKNEDGTKGDYYSTVNSFEGTFDGQGHTIANFYQNTWEIKGDYDANYYKDAMGLFGYVVNGTVKNLTVDHFSSDGEFTPTGVIAAYAVNSNFENIAITNCNPRVYNTGNGGIVGIGGNSDDPDTYELTFTNITIDNSNIISALWGSWDVACGGLVGMFRGAGHVYMTNCHVAAQIDVYNDVCGNYQYYWYRYAGMMVGTNKNMITDANGYTVPETSKFHAVNCTVHFGEWNDYYYCELVANSLASYTHDHQFSRLEQIKSLDEIKSGDTWTKTGNFLLISGDTKTCYHIVKNSDGTLKQHLHTDAGEETVNGETVLKEDKQIVYLPFNQLFTGYGWGVKHIPVYNGEDFAFKGITILGREVADSETKFATKFTGDFLYRVGNLNSVSLNSLFAAAPRLDEAGYEQFDDEGNTICWDINDPGVYVTIEKVDENSNAGGTFTANTTDWTKGTIKFSGTGVVKVTIQDYNFCTPTVLYLEVVDAENLTSAKGTITGGNFVLLCDVNTSGYVNYWNSSLYGNGFTYSLKDAPTAYNSKQGHGILIADNAIFDNLVIVGDVYDKYGAYSTNDCYNAAIDVMGQTVIQNCYIYGCAAPVSARASVTITNTTLHGGTVANMIIKSGVATLENVTTANFDDGRSLIGMGIVIHSDATEATKLVLNGTLTQYNFISETKTPSDLYAKKLYDAMFDNACKAYHFGKSPNRYVNACIISMSEKFGPDNIIDNAGTNYVGTDVIVNDVDGYVYTRPNTLGSVNNNYDKNEDSHVSTTQGPIEPDYEFDHQVNALEEQDKSCREENGIVYISMPEGVTFEWNPSILCFPNLDDPLDYSVKMNQTDYTGQKITFDKAGDYVVEYTYTNSDNNKLDSEGNIIKYSQTYTKTVHINVATVKAAWKDSEIEVNNTSMSGIYVMSGDYDYSYKMKFLDCVTITDYDEAGNAATVDLSKNIKSTSFVSWKTNDKGIKEEKNPGLFDNNDGMITITYNDGKVLTVKIGAWSGSGPSTKTCSVKTDDGVYLITDGASNAANIDVSWKITGYTYTGNNGKLVSNNTGITFSWNKDSEGYNSKSECVTPDTLITLADGSQVRVDSLKGDEQLLVWNLLTGKYDTAPIVFVDSEAEQEYEIIHLYFSDGSDVKVISEHGFFDLDLGKYVYIDATNYADYIGHRFVSEGSIKSNDWNVVTLKDVVLEKEVTTAWSPVTFEHLCYYTNGVLSMPGGIEGLFNIFEVDTKTMRYDAKLMQKDIDTYGLFTIEDFGGMITQDAFDAFNGAYLKVAMGKGLLTWEDIAYTAERYIPLMK